jgi:hypothetical protein
LFAEAFTPEVLEFLQNPEATSRVILGHLEE